MKRVFVSVLVFVLHALDSLAAGEACLRYEPAVVQLSGRLMLRTFPGPPNYESIQTGDRAETQALLELDRPICVLADAKDGPSSDDERDQRVVTLVPASGLRAARYAGARVRVEGTLFHAQTGHHRTAVLIDAKRVTRLGGRGAGPTRMDQTK